MTLKRKLAFGGAALVLVAAVCFGFGYRAHTRLVRQVERERALRKARGEKLTIAEILSQVPQHRAAGDALYDALQRFGSSSRSIVAASAGFEIAPGTNLISWSEANLQSVLQDTNGVSWQGLESDLQVSRDQIEQLVSVVMTNGVFELDLDYPSGLAMDTPLLVNRRCAAQHLQAASTLALHTSKLDESRRLLVALVHLVNADTKSRTLIVQSMRLALLHFTFESTWQALQATGWSDAELRSLAEEWSRVSLQDALEPTIQMQWASTLELVPRSRSMSYLEGFDSLAQVDGDTVGEKISNAARQSWNQVEGIGIGWSWKYFGSYRCELSLLPMGEELRRVFEGFRKNQSYSSVLKQLRHITRESGGFTEPTAAAAEQFFAESIKRDARSSLTNALLADIAREVVSAAIALKRNQVRGGRIPETLVELVPEFLPSVPHDYGDGKAIRYRKISPDRFVLYSVGADGKDDGGMAGAKSWRSSRDLVWPQVATDDQREQFKRTAAESRRTSRVPGGVEGE